VSSANASSSRHPERDAGVLNNTRSSNNPAARAEERTDMPNFELHGKVAVVTGGGQGIGEGIALAFARAGAAVIVAARHADRIERRALAVRTDVTDPAALNALAASAVETFGGLHIWVNNAGGSPVRSSLGELSDDDWSSCLAVNLTAVWRATNSAVERMTEGGSIIHITSPAATRAVPGSGHYAAAKAGVNALTLTMAEELAPKIRVNAIAPGFVPTEVMMTALKTDVAALESMAAKRIPLKRLGTPDDIAAAAIYLASDAGSWVTGQILTVSGGL
jgi:NAD(P)-dependent dehydrogenase (short-subunit alcohol dehydrogenase family)